MVPIFICGVKIQMPKPVYCWKGNFIRINIVLTIRVQKWACFEVLIENQKNLFLKM